MSSKLKSLKTTLRQATSSTKTTVSASKQRTESAAVVSPKKGTTATAKSNSGSNNRRFNNNTAKCQSSPFKSFITTGTRVRRPLSQCSDFAYDLSKEELTFMGSFKSPMKAVPDSERELLKNGQRGAYLAMRYEHPPDRKYNYPEATSWRIGWLHNQLSRQPSPLLSGAK